MNIVKKMSIKVIILTIQATADKITTSRIITAVAIQKYCTAQYIYFLLIFNANFIVF